MVGCRALHLAVVVGMFRWSGEKGSGALSGSGDRCRDGGARIGGCVHGASGRVSTMARRHIGVMVGWHDGKCCVSVHSHSHIDVAHRASACRCDGALARRCACTFTQTRSSERESKNSLSFVS